MKYLKMIMILAFFVGFGFAEELLDKRISFHIENQPLEWVMTHFAEQNNLLICYEEAISTKEDSEKLLSVNYTDLTVKDCLDKLTKNTKYTWKILSNIILVLPVDAKDKNYIINEKVPDCEITGVTRSEAVNQIVKKILDSTKGKYKETDFAVVSTSEIKETIKCDLSLKNKSLMEALIDIAKKWKCMWCIMLYDVTKEYPKILAFSYDVSGKN